jgi:hypothetical protein
MKKLIIALVLFLPIAGINFAQENQHDNSITAYTFLVNIVNEQFQFPLIGFINIARGSQSLPQIGFINWNQNNFGTLQWGFVNTAGGDMAGLQMGFVNTVAGGMRGFQFGFINTVVKSFKGLQLGFVNTAKQVKGLQFGFINYAGSIEKGIPIGFLSIVRNGGYRAIESGVSEISPFNLSFKIGVEKFYTSFIAAYNPFREGIRKQLIWGAGFGTIIQLGETIYINPEITSHHGINEDFQHYVSIIPYFGYTTIPNLSIVAGPSLVWAYNNKGLENLFYRIAAYSINDTNKLYLGARMALRFRW